MSRQMLITKVLVAAKKDIEIKELPAAPPKYFEVRECSAYRRNDKAFCHDPFYKCRSEFCEWFKP